MPTTRRLVATALAAAGIGVATAPAAVAQTYPPTGGGGTTVTETTFVAPPVTNGAALPRTGEDVLAATAIGVGALAVGGALLLAGRRRRSA